MRIKKLQLTEDWTKPYGLKEFKSNRLNGIIALVGKNGSGKTRYLRIIEQQLRNITLADIANQEIDSLPNEANKILGENIKKIPFISEMLDVEKLKTKRDANPQSIDIRDEANRAEAKFGSKRHKSLSKQQYQQLNNTIRQHVSRRLKVIKPEDFRALKTSFDSNSQGKIKFKDLIDSTLEEVYVDEFSMIGESALVFLQKLPHKLAFDDLDTKGDEKKFKARVAYKRFSLLRELIIEFLGKKLEWKSKKTDVDEHEDHISIKATGFWTIDGREFNYSLFSEGEKVLFTYALLLFLLNNNPRIKFKESIIIIDEPELNLHPKAQIKLIESLQDLIKDEGQLIIATHSLSIVSNLDYGSIHLVRENQMYSPASTIPFESVDDLMGFDEHYNKIVEFLVSTPSWAMTNFMAQCFESPEVIEEASKKDPQLEVFKKLIQKNNINILDFGSGKGRLLEKLKESDGIWSRIQNYDCFDINPAYNESNIAKGAKIVINDLSQIENGKYDLIILVNVLHEVHIKYWTKSLNKINKSLKSDGFVAIMEDTELPIGELPNEHGFLILGKGELKILLGDKTSFITSDIERYKDRIICGIIQKSDMHNINKNKLVRTLNNLQSHSMQSIIEYRNMTQNDLRLGRLYALKANLYMNSEIALKYLNEN